MKMKQGFTLVEIMIVVAIIGILAAIAIPSFQRSRDTTRANSCVNNLRLIDAAIEQWGMATHAPAGEEPDDDDVAEYIRGNELPDCPASREMDYAWDAWDNADVRCEAVDADGDQIHGSLADYLESPTNWAVFDR